MEIEFSLSVSIKFEDSVNPNYSPDEKKMDAAMENVLRIVKAVTNGLLAPHADILSIGEEASINIYNPSQEPVK